MAIATAATEPDAAMLAPIEKIARFIEVRLRHYLEQGLTKTTLAKH
jgi:hypothetical protein